MNLYQYHCDILSMKDFEQYVYNLAIEIKVLLDRTNSLNKKEKSRAVDLMKLYSNIYEAWYSCGQLDSERYDY